MLQAKGNLFSSGATKFVVTTNGIVKANGKAVMGAGIAKYARDNFRGVDSLLGKYLSLHGNHVYQLTNDLVSFPTKHDWRDDSDMDLIIQSTHELVALADEHNWLRIAMPPVGCGMGRLTWSEVRQAIEPLLDNRFVVFFQ